jgi:membrane-bound lytic murein transglycosylase D
VTQVDTPEKTDNGEVDMPMDSTLNQSVAKEIESVTLTKNTTHSVKKGDTFYSIAKLYGIPVMQLIEDNKLSINSPLSIGQELKIKPAKIENEPTEAPAVPSSEQRYVVKQGDTLYKIAREFEVSVDEIIELNQKTGSEVKVDEILLIPARNIEKSN